MVKVRKSGFFYLHMFNCFVYTLHILTRTHQASSLILCCVKALQNCTTHAVVCTRWPFLNTGGCAFTPATREHSHCESVLGACCGISLGWNSMHLVPSKQSQTFHFRWKWRVCLSTSSEFSIQQCRCKALNKWVEVGPRTETMSWDEMPSGLLTPSILSLVPYGQWPQA